jgi:hypothetical protein
VPELAIVSGPDEICSSLIQQVNFIESFTIAVNFYIR